MEDNIVGGITKIFKRFFMARKCKKESMRAHGISTCEGQNR